jgi:hypothetical protein
MLANRSVFGKPHSLAQGKLLVNEFLHATKTKTNKQKFVLAMKNMFYSVCMAFQSSSTN